MSEDISIHYDQSLCMLTCIQDAKFLPERSARERIGGRGGGGIERREKRGLDTDHLMTKTITTQHRGMKKRDHCQRADATSRRSDLS